MRILRRSTGVPCDTICCCNLRPVLVGAILPYALQGFAYACPVPDILQIILRSLCRPERDIADIEVYWTCDTVYAAITGILPGYQWLRY